MLELELEGCELETDADVLELELEGCALELELEFEGERDVLELEKSGLELDDPPPVISIVTVPILESCANSVHLKVKLSIPVTSKCGVYVYEPSIGSVILTVPNIGYVTIE